MMLRCPCALDHLQMPELHSRPDVDVPAVLHVHPPSLVLGGVPLGISDDARQSSLNPHMAERIHPLVGLVSHDPSNHHGGGLACPVPAASVGDFVSFEYPKFPFFMGFLALSEINALVIELVEFKNINLIKARLKKERSEQAL